jgi:septum formation protein
VPSTFALSLPLILASGSPRRKELLAQLGVPFTVVTHSIDEDALTVADPWKTAENLAIAKAETVAKLYPGHLVLGGDTVVALADDGGWMQLGKPIDCGDAVRMLTLLSGRQHQVITGCALVSPVGTESMVASTKVTFRELSRNEIERYVDTGEPMDKAGGYGFQSGAAGFVVQLDGEIETVVGLPLSIVGQMLSGWRIS